MPRIVAAGLHGFSAVGDRHGSAARRAVPPDGLARSLPDVLLPFGKVARRLVVPEGLLRSLPDFVLGLEECLMR